VRSTKDFDYSLYDYKYAEQSSRIAGIAADAGYKVSILPASWKAGSVTADFTFAGDATDGDMARQVAGRSP
jgi:hypothetical protein